MSIMPARLDQWASSYGCSKWERIYHPEDQSSEVWKETTYSAFKEPEDQWSCYCFKMSTWDNLSLLPTGFTEVLIMHLALQRIGLN